jgi:MoxR-like ATPase
MGVNVAADANVITAAVAAVAGVRLTEEITAYIVDIVRATRETSAFEVGASPRSAAMLAAAVRARAALDGRDYTIPDDVKELALPTLRHRVILSPAADIEGRTVDQSLSAILSQIEAPR